MARIETEAQLRAIYGEAHPRAVAKQIDRLDRHCLRFMELSPFCMIATSDGSRLDVSPKGDLPGFVQADGEHAVLIPDWPGNGRIDGLINITTHPRAALILMIPNVRETLRINGAAEIRDDADLRARFETRGKLPITVLRVEAEEVFLHCAKAFMRSDLWKPETWPPRDALPTMGEMLRDHAALDAAPESEAEMEARYDAALY